MVAAAPPSARQRKRGQDQVHDYPASRTIRACCIDPTCSELECPLSDCISFLHGPKVDPYRNERIRASHRSGLPVTAIALDEGISERQVKRVLRSMS